MRALALSGGAAIRRAGRSVGPTASTGAGRRSRSERRDARLADAPRLLQVQADALGSPREPAAQELPVALDLVRPDLVDGDRLLVQEAGDGLGARRHPGDVDARPLVAQEAVRLRDAVEPVPRQHRAHARRVALVHLVDRQRELDLDRLLARQRREQRVLGGAGPAPLVEDQPEAHPLRDAPVGQPPHVARGRREVGRAQVAEPSGERAVAAQRPAGETLERVVHHQAPRSSWARISLRCWSSDGAAARWLPGSSGGRPGTLGTGRRPSPGCSIQVTAPVARTCGSSRNSRYVLTFWCMSRAPRSRAERSAMVRAANAGSSAARRSATCAKRASLVAKRGSALSAGRSRASQRVRNSPSRRMVRLIQPSRALKVPEGVSPGWGLPPSRWCWIIDTAWMVEPPRSRLDSM